MQIKYSYNTLVSKQDKDMVKSPHVPGNASELHKKGLVFLSKWDLEGGGLQNVAMPSYLIETPY